MAQFGEYARHKYFNHKRTSSDPALTSSYAATFEFQLECEQSSQVLRKDWENIEELYTQADLRRVCSADPTSAASTCCDHISWVIWDVYRDGVSKTGGTSYPDVFSGHLGLLLSRGQTKPTVITTNYDLVVEAALSRASIPFYYPGFRAPSRSERRPLQLVQELGTERETEGEGIPMIKLHGSVNWFALGDKWYCSMATERKDELKAVSNPAVSRNQILDDVQAMEPSVDRTTIRPAIIPPMLGKSSESPVIAHQWRAAMDAIARAKQMFVIGYSFPETDLFMSRLLVDGLHRNRDLSNIFVADLGSIELWTPKLKRLFNPVFLEKKLRFVCGRTPFLTGLLNGIPPTRFLDKAQAIPSG